MQRFVVYDEPAKWEVIDTSNIIQLSGFETIKCKHNQLINQTINDMVRYTKSKNDLILKKI